MTRAVHVTVLGGGSWGTTVASLAARNTPTTLWARDSKVVCEVNAEHTNSRYLGQRRLDRELRAVTELAEAIDHADLIVVALPSHAIRGVLEQAAPDIRAWIPVLSLAKGLESTSRLRPTQVISEVFPGHPVGVLAGPNIAGEVLDGYAGAAAVATEDAHVATALQGLFLTKVFRVYRNTDVLGSELGGILKNIIAIASGMADGLGVGHNTRSMVLTRGLAEITRLGEAMGAHPATFAGLTGLGDLMATCSSPASRNRRVGEELAHGKSLQQIIDEMSQVAEGVKTVRTVIELANEHGVTMPIAEEVDAVINGDCTPAAAYRGLLREEPQHEWLENG